LTIAVVVTCNLVKDDARGNTYELPSVIEFTISSFSTDEATGPEMEEAVLQAMTAFEHIVPSPRVDTADMAGSVILPLNDVLTKTALWEPLLEKVKLCTEIVDKIAEVS
jgi:hypothetical protein